MKRFVALAFIVIITGVLAACGRAPEIVETPRLGNPGNFERADVGADFSPIITDNFTPAVSLAYLAFTDEVERLGAGALNGLNYANTREEIADFIIDMVHPISSSDILNDITLHKITDVVDNFIASNSSGSIFGRPRSYSYNGHILGISMDFRYYGDEQGFGAGRLITNFDLESESQILPEQLFVEGVDFRAIFAALAEGVALTGNEDFTFDYEYIYLHIRTHEAPAQQDSYTVLPLPLTEFEGMWVGPAPETPPTGARMAITFDDGPHGRFTPQLLDALASRNISGTFFLMGPTARAYPQIVERMHSEGHQIGNHSYSHSLLTRLSSAQIRKEIDDTDSIIYGITGIIPTLVRPPFGGYNDQVLAVMAEMGKSIVNWSVDPRDWYHRNAEIVRDNILAHARDGSIVLVHDIHESSIQGAIMAIDILLARGYNFVTVSELYRLADLELRPGAVYRGLYRD